MKKKLFALTLVLISSISLAACGGNKMGKAPSSDESTKNVQEGTEDTLSKGENTTHKKYTDEEIDENYKKAGIDKGEIIGKHGSINVENESIGIEWDEEEKAHHLKSMNFPKLLNPLKRLAAFLTTR